MTDGNKNLQDVIKNPFRKTYTDPVEYIPEYVRLGIDPIPQNLGQADIASLDGEPIEEDEIKNNLKSQSSLNSHILDNNEYLNFGLPPLSKPKTENPDVGEFILMVKGKILGHGNHDYVLTQARSILYGEHPSFPKMEIPMEDIIILKRMGLKIGVFLDE